MSKSFEFDRELVEAVGKAKRELSKMLERESFSTSILQKKAEQGWNNHPNDQTLRMMAAVLQKMEENNKPLISRAELRNLYSKFESNNNKAISYFEEELGFSKRSGPKVTKYAENADIDLTFDVINEVKDSSIYGALSGMWDGETKNTGYKESLAKKAEKITSLTLMRLGIEPEKIKTIAGSEDFIICNAVYQTSVGDSNVLIPVEVVDSSSVLLPNSFVSKHGFVDLTKEAVKTHVQETAGKNIQVNSSLLLDTLGSIQKLSTMSHIELQIITAKEAYNKERGMVKLASSDSDTVALTTNPIFVSDIDPEVVNMEIPEVEGKQSFAEMLETPKGLAEHLFGKLAVNNGRAIVINKFAEFGYKPQVAVSSCSDDCIIYAAKVDSQNGPLGFEVLVDIDAEKKAPILPTVLAARDKVYDFSPPGIYQAISENSSDPKMVAQVSPMYDLKPSEILENFRNAADNKDYKTAEDALNVLSINGPKELYARACQEYAQSLSGQMLKQASTKCGCDMVIKVSNHSGPVCGHLNLPLEKVYQDERGYCRPLYRKNMEENYEGVLFNTAKIFG